MGNISIFNPTNYNLSRKTSNFYSNSPRYRKATGGTVSLLDRDK